MFIESGRQHRPSTLAVELAIAALPAYICVIALAIAPAGWFEPVSLLAFAETFFYVMLPAFNWSFVLWLVIGVPAFLLEVFSRSKKCHLSRIFAIPLFFLVPVYCWSGYWHVRCNTALSLGSWQYDVLFVLGLAAILANIAVWFAVGGSSVWRDCRVSAFCILWHELLLAAGSLFMAFLSLCVPWH